MSERLSEIRAHIVATRQLETVITAMRGVAAARTREAQARLEGVRAYAEALGEAIGAALSLQLGEREAPIAAEKERALGHILLAFCSSQGFVGAFNERVLTAVKKVLGASPAGRTALYLVGERGAALAEEQGLSLAWTTAMAAHVDETPALADRIAAALYERLGAGRAGRVSLIHGAPDGGSGFTIVERPLIPLDLSRFPPSRRCPPLINLPQGALVESLAQEYVFAELCAAATLSFAAENEARMQAMIAARSNVQKSLQELEARHRRQRQAEITEEIIELVRSAPGRGVAP
jgi:F-type H+-transporting ATPase subunit gamma